MANVTTFECVTSFDGCCIHGFRKEDLEKIDWKQYDAEFSYEKDENGATYEQIGWTGYVTCDVYHMFVKTTSPEKVKPLLEKMDKEYVAYKLPKDECVLSVMVPKKEEKEMIDDLSKQDLGFGMNIRVKQWHDDMTFMDAHFKRHHKEAFLERLKVVKQGPFPINSRTYKEQYYLEVLESVPEKVNISYVK